VSGWVSTARPRAGEQLTTVSRTGLVPRREMLRGAGLALLQRTPDALLRRAPELPRMLRPARVLLRRSAPGPGAEDRRPRPAMSLRIAAAIGWTTCGLALYALFLHMSAAVPVNSDGAANALQAWAMLHGNPLLHTWRLSDVTFYPTELPQYLLIELARGLRPDVVHIAAAMTYTFVILLAARLAKGGATGAHGLLRACIAAGIMVAPQHSEVTVLMLSPDHVGSTVPVMLAWLVVDRARRRWYVPGAVCLLLGLGLVADQIVLLTGIAPTVIVGLAVAYQRVICERGPLRAGGYGLALAAAGAGGAVAGWGALALIRVLGGFYVFPVSDRVAGFERLPANLLQTYQGLLLLFGADFMGQRPGLAIAIAFTHLAGLGLVGWGVCAALRRLTRCDLTVRLLTVGTLISLAAYALGPNASEALSSREFAAVLPFGAALASRMLARRLSRARLVPALIGVLAVYAVGAARVAGLPPVPAQNQAIADWLVAHKFSYGLGGYWMANSITLDSGGAVRVAPIKASRLVWPFAWEDDPGWFNPARHVANFVVLPSDGTGPSPGPGPNPLTVASAIATFGQPAKAYFLAGYTVLVWPANLLTALARDQGAGPAASSPLDPIRYPDAGRLTRS
jgi:hypothetical protein